jgi:hypothetical protein
MQTGWLTILWVQNIIGKKYAKMGAEPLKDMLMSMRFRSKEMKKFTQTEQKQMNWKY